METGLNPWGQPKTQFVTAHGQEPVAGNFRAPGQGSSLVNASGEINASSVRDMLMQIDTLMQAKSSGQIVQQKTQEEQTKSRAMLASAYNDPTGKQWAMLGANIADGIREQATREGFMRRLLAGSTLEQGQTPRYSVHENNAMAVVATSSSEVEYQAIRNKSFTPDEFHLVANLMVEDIDIQQVSGDILERTYNDGVEAIMTGEDRIWKIAADATAGTANSVTYIGSTLSPSILSSIRSGVSAWGLPASTMLLANDLWDDIIGNTEFHSLFSPIQRHDLVLNGQIGSILGMTVITDAFRAPSQKVLERGELYAVASPEYHGGYTDRGGVVPTPIDGAQRGSTSKGWFLKELMSLAVVSPRSVSIGRRL